MNRKSEYGHNHLTRLEARLSEWDQDFRMAQEAALKRNEKKSFSNFVDVVKNVICYENTKKNVSTVSTCRLNNKRHSGGGTVGKWS